MSASVGCSTSSRVSGDSTAVQPDILEVESDQEEGGTLKQIQEARVQHVVSETQTTSYDDYHGIVPVTYNFLHGCSSMMTSDLTIIVYKRLKFTIV